MNDLLEYLQKLWQAAGYPGIAVMLGLLAVVMPTIRNFLTQLWTLRKQRILKRDLFPFYTELEVQRATKYYVETKCQNVAPSKEEEPEYSDGVVAKRNALSFFLNKAFKPKKEDCQFYIVLADSGMGKTTFLLNVYLRYINQFFHPTYHIRLFPLGFPEIDKEIEAIADDEKKQTILLLDAFDEDIQAVTDYKTRLPDLIQNVLYFRKVVITCRTQFFPSEVEEPGQSGILHFGPEGGDRVFHKLYISPFDAKDIRRYLRKRFGWWHWRKKRKARQIVMSCPNLMVRPMLLSYIEDLLQRERPYTATYKVYAELINKWVEREARKVPPDRHKHYMEKFYRFSREIAVDLYRRRVERQGSLLIPGEEIQPFAEEHSIKLEDKEIKARSLLNRNARGDYKFSHKSVLEYFLAEEAFFNANFRKELDFEGMNQAEAFFDEMIWEKLTVPFFDRSDLKGEYRLEDGKPKALAKLNVKILPQITYLKLTEWNPSEDVLLFRGLKSLERLTLGTITSTQEDEIQHALPKCQIQIVFRLPLRSEPLTVSDNDFSEVFGLDEGGRPCAYIQNDYEAQAEVVIDHATGLIWQKSGSPAVLIYPDAQKYVEELNRQQFAGYENWRLPMILELMSLLELEKKNEDLYIDPIFDPEQRYCWSANRLPEGERGSSGAAWDVTFVFGLVYWLFLGHLSYVRCVRSKK